MSEVLKTKKTQNFLTEAALNCNLRKGSQLSQAQSFCNSIVDTIA